MIILRGSLVAGGKTREGFSRVSRLSFLPALPKRSLGKILAKMSICCEFWLFLGFLGFSNRSFQRYDVLEYFPFVFDSILVL